MVIRTLLQAGDPLLSEKNIPVTSFKSLKVQQVIENLIDTMYEFDLIGISAPQIGENYRIFVTHARATKARAIAKEDELRVYINPRIKKASKELITLYEGCGSVQQSSVFGPVTRPTEIEVIATDKKRKKFSLTCDGILARVILHEYDHLQNTLFTQKQDPDTSLLTADDYISTIKNSADHQQASTITKIEYKLL